MARTRLYEQSISTYLSEGPHGQWLRMLLMYAYSVDYGDTDALPAALAVPTLREFASPNAWVT